MAGTITATSLFSPIAKLQPSSSPVLGLPKIKRVVRVQMCSMEAKPSTQVGKDSPRTSMGGPLMAAAATAMWSPAALALVDDRMSTEGTGLPFGLSNGLLGWILLGVFALIWSLYFVYASSLDEDDDSGLSL